MRRRGSGRRCAVFLIGCATLALGVTASASTSSAPSFAGPRAYRLAGEEETSHTLATADLNGDGALDVVAASEESEVVTVLLNRHGRLARSHTYVIRSIAAIAVADLDGDGSPDLAAAAGYPDRVWVLLNQGGGRFRLSRKYPVDSNLYSLAIGDLNGDGKLDLAAENGYGVSVLLNAGGGAFSPARGYATGSGSGLTLGDLTGDGLPDVVTGDDSTTTVSVLANKGNGTFGPRRDYHARSGREAGVYEVAVGDLNADGRPELVTLSSNAQGDWVAVFPNLGGSHLGPRRDHRAYGIEGLALADLTGDGLPEVVTLDEWAGRVSIVSVLKNKGAYALGPPRAWDGGDLVDSLAIGDVTGDGENDLLTAGDRLIKRGSEGLDTLYVLPSSLGRCGVPRVRGDTLGAAKREIAQAHCRTGKVRRAFSGIKKGLVISIRPGAGSVLPAGRRVSLVVSRGRKS